MSDLTIITNNVPRDVIYAYELTPTEQEEFDYLNWSAIEAGMDSASFFRYRGDLYDLGEFTAWTDREYPQSWGFRGWDGYQSDSFFSGLLIRYCDDLERVVVGRFYS